MEFKEKEYPVLRNLKFVLGKPTFKCISKEREPSVNLGLAIAALTNDPKILVAYKSKD